MESFERAFSLARELKAALDAEVTRAQGERVLIRNFDVQGLFKRAAMRGDFNSDLLRLQGALGKALEVVGEELELPEVSLESLGRAVPTEARRLSALLAEVRALACALGELDDLNRRLALRASACVRGYLNTVAPPATYDRRGAAPAMPTTTFSGRA